MEPILGYFYVGNFSNIGNIKTLPAPEVGLGARKFPTIPFILHPLTTLPIRFSIETFKVSWICLPCQWTLHGCWLGLIYFLDIDWAIKVSLLRKLFDLQSWRYMFSNEFDYIQMVTFRCMAGCQEILRVLLVSILLNCLNQFSYYLKRLKTHSEKYENNVIIRFYAMY